MRSLRLSLALAFAGALPVLAEPLPQGHFMAAPYLADDTLLPRYIALEVAGTDLEMGFLSAIVLNFEACEASQICDLRVAAATAEAEIIDQNLALKDVDILADIGIDEPRFGPPHLRYTAPLMAAMDGATVAITPDGFDIGVANDVISFYRAAPDVQAAITAYAVAMELSIRSLGGCDVAILAPLFAAPDPTGAEVMFLNALRAMATQIDIEGQNRTIGDAALDPEDPNHDQAHLLFAAGALPNYLALATDPGPLQDRLAQVFEIGPFTRFADDPQALEAVLVRYDGTLADLVAFYDHIGATRPDITSEAACADPSLGFIDAQGG